MRILTEVKLIWLGHDNCVSRVLQPSSNSKRDIPDMVVSKTSGGGPKGQVLKHNVKDASMSIESHKFIKKRPRVLKEAAIWSLQQCLWFRCCVIIDASRRINLVLRCVTRPTFPPVRWRGHGEGEVRVSLSKSWSLVWVSGGYVAVREARQLIALDLTTQSDPYVVAEPCQQSGRGIGSCAH